MIRGVETLRLRGLARVAVSAAAAIAILAVAGSAGASRITLTGDERINTLTGGLAGTSYLTPSGGVDYDEIGGGGAHPGEVLVTGTIGPLNYHTTDAPGVNITEPLVDLDFTLRAELLGIDAVNKGGSIYDITLSYGTATPTLGEWDLIVTDPDDGDALVFRADLIAGTFFGQEVAPIEVSDTNVDISSNDNPIFTATALLTPDFTTEYSDLFYTDTGQPLSAAFSFSQVLNWNPGFTTIGSSLTGEPPTLISHTAQATGSAFGVESAFFIPIPEPATAVLMGLGLVWLGVRCRRGRSD